MVFTSGFVVVQVCEFTFFGFWVLRCMADRFLMGADLVDGLRV